MILCISKAMEVPPKTSRACVGCVLASKPGQPGAGEGCPCPPGALSSHSSSALGAGERPHQQEELPPHIHPLCRALQQPGRCLRVLR